MDLLVEQMNALQNQLNYFQGKIAILKNIADRDVHGQDSQGDTQMHLVLQNIQVNENVIKQLLDMGARVNATNYTGQTPLHYALRYRNCDNLSIVRLLVERGTDLERVDNWGHVPIIYAVENENCPHDVIKFLIEKGANVQVIDTSGFSLLHHALLNKHSSFDTIKLLLDKGVDVYKVNIYGETALHTAVRLHRKDVVKVLLEKPKIKVNLPDKARYTPLHRAICSTDSDPEIVKLLLESGANVQKKTKFDEQSLHLAAYHCNPAIIRLLLDYNARVNVLDKRNQTPLFIAVSRCVNYNRVAVKSLLDAGALVFNDHPMRKLYPRQDCPFDYHSPLHIAVNLYHKEQSEETMQRALLLLKYAILERPRLCYRTFQVTCQTRRTLVDFHSKCTRELASCIKPKVTLAQFILQSRLQEDEECPTDEILKVLNANVTPVYKEVISGMLTRSDLKDAFERHIVYAAVKGPKRTKTPNHVVLDNHSTGIILKYLSDEELLNLLLVLYNAKNRTDPPINFSPACEKCFPCATSLDEIEEESERYFKRARIN